MSETRTCERCGVEISAFRKHQCLACRFETPPVPPGRNALTIVCRDWTQGSAHTAAIVGLPIAIDRLVELTKAFGTCWDCGAGLVMSADPVRNAEVHQELRGGSKT